MGKYWKIIGKSWENHGKSPYEWRFGWEKMGKVQ